MQVTKHSFRPIIKKVLNCLVVLLALLNIMLFSIPGTVSAKSDDSTFADQLEIKIGYTGGTYTSVHTFQLSELESLPQVQQAYSFIDSLPCPVIDSAVGVKLTDILAACNIEVDNVKSFRFWTTDVPNSPYVTLSKTYLLDTSRYYFPHLGDNWNTDNDNGEICFPSPSAAAADAVQVPTILTIHDNWLRELSGSLKPDYATQSDSSRFRLVFGKTNDLSATVPEHTASKSAKWVNKIDVTLNGTAVTGITLDKTTVSLTVGSVDQLTATVAPAGATNQSVTWVSDNTTVATVDNTGKVTAITAGIANITATTRDGSKTAFCSMTVTGSGQQFATPPELTASSNNILGQDVTLKFTDDAAWRSQITDGVVKGTSIAGKYRVSVAGTAGTISIKAGVFTTADDYSVIVKAKGYQDTGITLTMNNVAAVLTNLDLSGGPILTYISEAISFNLNNLTLVGADQNGSSFNFPSQSVSWAVLSGPATVSGSTLTITGSGRIDLTAKVGSVTSNSHHLTVGGSNTTGLPDQIILSWTGDTRTTQTIAWRTGTDTTQDQVQYLPADGFIGSFTGARVVTAIKSDLYARNSHFEATLPDLNPATSYVYRVGREGAWSKPASFTTASTSNQFSFLYMGDVQEGYSDWGEMLDKAYQDNLGLKFGLLGGDLVENGRSSAQWQQFFANASPEFARIPLMPAPGNHDDYPLFYSSFALPQNGPDGYKESFYSFDYGNSHIAVLDSNYLGTIDKSSPDYNKLSTWLQNNFSASRQLWKLLVFHHPPYGAVSDAYAANLQATWVPLFEQCQVDVAFSGHQHIYLRTKPIHDGHVEADPGDGIVYVMGNAGTKFYAQGLDYDYIAKEIPYVSNYEVITINGDTFTLTAKDGKGQVIDNYVINKKNVDPVYTVTPMVDAAYQNGATTDGITTMTVKDGSSGLKYFGVQIAPVKTHEDQEAVVFVHLRDGIQQSINITKADFDVVTIAQAEFNVQAGDVVKVYIVDDITNDINSNSKILQ